MDKKAKTDALSPVVSNTETLTYDEAVKDPQTRRMITERWRTLGLTAGIPLNSKTEKTVIEGYERMTRYFIHEVKPDEYTQHFPTVIYPIIRFIYASGEKLTGKRVHNPIPTEELFRLLKTTKLSDMEDLIKENTPKNTYTRIQPLFRLNKFKGISDKTITQLEYEDYNLTDDEYHLLGALFREDSPVGNSILRPTDPWFDYEAENLKLVTAYLVFKINKDAKEKKQ